MIRALYSGATGMYAQQLNIDNISHNMANVNTNGFRKSRMQFQDLIYQTLKEAGAATSDNTSRPTELTVGVGVKPIASQKSFMQGTLNQTGNPLDIAIAGDGFFQLQDFDGNLVYSRDGAFKMNEEGEIVNAQGLYLEPAITIPADTESISITSDGIVYAKIMDTIEPEEIGQIELARFVNPAGLESAGGNIFRETTASGEPMVGTPGSETFGTLEQGYIENSNVVIVEEMVNMIVAQRAYELNSKSIQTADRMIQTANGLKR